MHRSCHNAHKKMKSNCVPNVYIKSVIGISCALSNNLETLLLCLFLIQTNEDFKNKFPEFSVFIILGDAKAGLLSCTFFDEPINKGVAGHLRNNTRAASCGPITGYF